MKTDLAVPAYIRLGKPADHVIALPSALLFVVIGNQVDEVRQQPGVFLLPQQRAIGRQPVAAGPPGLLIILFHRLRKRDVNHGTHGGFVDPESERDGSHQDAHFVRHPALLVALAHPSIHLGMVRDGRDAFFG